MNRNTIKLAKRSSQTKGDAISWVLQYDTGATIAELAKTTASQRRSVRSSVSGTLKKKSCRKIKSSKEENKDRLYFVMGRAQ